MSETILDVMGMSCPSCVRHIDEALRGVDGVETVEVRLADGTVAVRHETGAAPVQTLIAALRDAGYDALPAD
ncbi:heavy-metal-associated domain-containing protein [Vulgatibacter sp.]|uniref:heavy-metal-associated domain-containing protein n=1 Tax=Vulgatibacter sp. TaxID=1971226 RepID=UPI0035644B97